MLCSNCSKKVKPIVAIDIDGTLGDYHGHFVDFARAYLGVDGTFKGMVNVYDGTEPFGVWFSREFETDLTQFRQIKLAYRQGGMKRTMQPHEGAAVLISTLRASGTEVWITTTRPYLRLDGVDPDTRFWLQQYGIEYDGLLYDEDKYQVLAENVDRERVVGVLDDLDYQLKSAANEFGVSVPILRRIPYNRGVNSLYMSVSTLSDALEVLQQRTRNWRAEHVSS